MTASKPNTRSTLTDAEIEEIANRPFDPANGVVVHRRAPAKVVLSARVDVEISEWLIQQAADRDVTPSQFLSALLADLIAERKAAETGQVRRLVDVKRLHQAIDDLAAAM